MVSSSIYFKTISIYAHIIQLEFTITLVNPPAVCSVTLATGTLCDRIRYLIAARTTITHLFTSIE